MHELVASFVIPAHNEENNIRQTVDELRAALQKAVIPYEIIVVNDNSEDHTPEVVETIAQADRHVKLVNRTPPCGFGRAVRTGIDHITGDVVIIYMADLSDDPRDAIRYYEKIEEGYDCVFGSRFRPESRVEKYPLLKLLVNRIVNRCIQLMFFCPYNDLTNAFKAYRADVVDECGPFHASHFNITIEMSLSALTHKYSIAQIPINWYGRTWGSSHLKISEMGRRYLAVLLKAFSERLLISDDIMAERVAHANQRAENADALRRRINALQKRLNKLSEQQPEDDPATPED